MIYNRELLRKHLEAGYDLSNLGHRATGRTTAAVLGALAYAYHNPGRKACIDDDSCPDGYSARKMLKATAETIIEQLGIKGFVVEQADSRVYIVNNWTVSL